MEVTETCPFSGHNEEWHVDARLRGYKLQGCQVFKEYGLPHGSIDLVAISPENVLILAEYKLSAKLSEVTQALGQLLIYREQINKTRFSNVISRIEICSCVDIHTSLFLKKVCARYGVTLTFCQHCNVSNVSQNKPVGGNT